MPDRYCYDPATSKRCINFVNALRVVISDRCSQACGETCEVEIRIGRSNDFKLSLEQSVCSYLAVNVEIVSWQYGLKSNDDSYSDFTLRSRCWCPTRASLARTAFVSDMNTSKLQYVQYKSSSFLLFSQHLGSV